MPSESPQHISAEEIARRISRGFLLKTIDSLMEIVHLQDRYHEGYHSVFVGDKAYEVCKMMGISDIQADEARMAGYLHDIGKLGFPELLRIKPAHEMSHAELAYYTTHVEIGVKILSHHEGLKPVAALVAQHHERLDGSGFPAKLRGPAIDIRAQIIAVADAYHNLMHRLARERSEHSKATLTLASGQAYLQATQQNFARTMNYLQRYSGQYFDARIIACFTEIIEKERRMMGLRTFMRLAVNQLKPGMMFGEDYFTSFGLLIAARGEMITEEMVPRLMRFSETGELPQKVLMMK
jgi:putative nucleotidyltransferase with HDIG domain